MKERRRLLEEEIKREGGVGAKPFLDATGKPIVDASGKPSKTSIPLVDASGKVLGEKDLSEYHISEDIEAVLKQRESEGVKESVHANEKMKNEQSKTKNEQSKMKNEQSKTKNEQSKTKNEQNKTKTEQSKASATHTMKSASEAMLNVYDAKEGDTIEICPEACMLMQEVVQWLETTTGGEEERG